ncbi:hypothetical protein [Streptomyces sp. YIM 98790]|uniref:hypothetical protein n=1 Tax=Streptomyces sp. YIM 98790 TaxID=2689077 RepID=UPI00140BF403|nr:hypothetical protein [Streptomyces sp. YIM 98790]
MSLFKRRPAHGKPGEWFYCLKHGTVEEGPECPAKDRLGPYSTRAEAEHAIDLARKRNEEWQHDPRWNDPDPGQDTGGAGSPER